MEGIQGKVDSISMCESDVAAGSSFNQKLSIGSVSTVGTTEAEFDPEPCWL